LENGNLVSIGTPEDVCNLYLEKSLQKSYGEKFTLEKVIGNDQNKKNVTIIDQGARATVIDNVAGALE
jgi:hypothetical protein